MKINFYFAIFIFVLLDYIYSGEDFYKLLEVEKMQISSKLNLHIENYQQNIIQIKIKVIKKLRKNS